MQFLPLAQEKNDKYNQCNVCFYIDFTMIAYSNTIIFHSPGEHRMTL